MILFEILIFEYETIRRVDKLGLLIDLKLVGYILLSSDLN